MTVYSKFIRLYIVGRGSPFLILTVVERIYAVSKTIKNRLEVAQVFLKSMSIDRVKLKLIICHLSPFFLLT